MTSFEESTWNSEDETQKIKCENQNAIITGSESAREAVQERKVIITKGGVKRLLSSRIPLRTPTPSSSQSTAPQNVRAAITKATTKPLHGAGECVANETTTELNNISSNYANICKECLAKHNKAVKLIENMSTSISDSRKVQNEIRRLKNEETKMEQNINSRIVENEKTIAKIITKWAEITNLKTINEELLEKVDTMENALKQKQKTIANTQADLRSLKKKYEEEKIKNDSTIDELNSKIKKLQEEAKREKKSVSDRVACQKNQTSSKVTELETKIKVAEEKSNESTNKLSKLQELMNKKESSWSREKDDMKKIQTQLQQEIENLKAEKETRTKKLEKQKKNTDNCESKKNFKSLESELEIKNQEILALQYENQDLKAKMEVDIEALKKLLETRDEEIKKLKSTLTSNSSTESKLNAVSNCMEKQLHSDQLVKLENTIKIHTDEISEINSSLKAHAQLAAALKFEKDSTISYCHNLKRILEEARHEIVCKNKTISEMRGKLSAQEKICEELKKSLNLYNADGNGTLIPKFKCQVCSKEHCSFSNSETDKQTKISESLISMSVKTVDHLCLRLDNLKRIKMAKLAGKKDFDTNSSWSSGLSPYSASRTNKLLNEVNLKTKLYSRRKDSDQSSHDSHNFLKTTASNSTLQLTPDQLLLKASNVKASKSFDLLSRFICMAPLYKAYNNIDKSKFFHH